MRERLLTVVGSLLQVDKSDRGRGKGKEKERERLSPRLALQVARIAMRVGMALEPSGSGSGEGAGHGFLRSALFEGGSRSSVLTSCRALFRISKDGRNDHLFREQQLPDIMLLFVGCALGPARSGRTSSPEDAGGKCVSSAMHGETILNPA